jgi:hypothetical protein
MRIVPTKNFPQKSVYGFCVPVRETPTRTGQQYLPPANPPHTPATVQPCDESLIAAKGAPYYPMTTPPLCEHKKETHHPVWQTCATL